MSQAKTFTLGGTTLPLDLPNVCLLESGDAALPMANGAIAFNFVYRGIAFVGRLDLEGQDARLKLVGDVGPMPFSAESTEARSGLARIVAATNDHLGKTIFKVTGGRMLLGGELDVAVPVTATGLIEVIARFLLPTTPYIDLVAIYVRPPRESARPGESAVRKEWRRR